jgi:hypothetical protein
MDKLIIMSEGVLTMGEQAVLPEIVVRRMEGSERSLELTLENTLMQADKLSSRR